MHEVRSAILSGQKPSEPSRVARERCRRSRGSGRSSLIGIEIPRTEQRVSDQRREDRFCGHVDRATIVFRRKKSLVQVVNVSSSGVMIDSQVVPNIGESVGIIFDGGDEIEGVVRWVKRGRVGLDVGEGNIELD
jgi:hypothetical protein